jgi:hypothetical protein
MGQRRRAIARQWHCQRRQAAQPFHVEQDRRELAGQREQLEIPLVEASRRRVHRLEVHRPRGVARDLEDDRCNGWIPRRQCRGGPAFANPHLHRADQTPRGLFEDDAWTGHVGPAQHRHERGQEDREAGTAIATPHARTFWQFTGPGPRDGDRHGDLTFLARGGRAVSAECGSPLSRRVPARDQSFGGPLTMMRVRPAACVSG